VIGAAVMLVAPELTSFMSLLEDVALGAAEGIADSEISYGELRLKAVLGTLISSVTGDALSGFSLTYFGIQFEYNPKSLSQTMYRPINAPANHILLKRIDVKVIKSLDEKNYIKTPLEICVL